MQGAVIVPVELATTMSTRMRGFLLGLELIQGVGKLGGHEVSSNVRSTRGSAIQIDLSYLLGQLV